MARKKSPKQTEEKYLEDRKTSINEKWTSYMKELNEENLDRDKLVFMMGELNSVDKLIIRRKRRDLLELFVI